MIRTRIARWLTRARFLRMVPEVQAIPHEIRLTYLLFDVLALNGKSLMHLPEQAPEPVPLHFEGIACASWNFARSREHGQRKRRRRSHVMTLSPSRSAGRVAMRGGGGGGATWKAGAPQAQNSSPDSAQSKNLRAFFLLFSRSASATLVPS
jgi:hypothetical protein